MSLIMKAMKLFWQNVKKNDDARLATQTEPEGIERICDIPYIDDGNRYHLLDVYYPENRVGNLPVIIDVHGGGWMYGDKELNKMYCLNLAKRGFTVFNISYQLVPNISVVEQIREVMCALKWIDENMKNYPCETDKIMLTGDSAGGMLAAYAASLLSSEKLRKIFGTVDCEMKLNFLGLVSPVSYARTCKPMCFYAKTMWGKVSKDIKNYMDLADLLPYTTLPPAYMVTSSGDFLALKQTRQAAEDFRKNGLKYKITDLPKFEGQDLPHVFSILEPESKAGNMVIDEMLEMFKSNI